ncbi:hypothetical protein DPMN_017012, partial [Dreissena polymorpha]
MDFRVFLEVKSQLRGIRFSSKQELAVAAKRFVSSFDADWAHATGQLGRLYRRGFPVIALINSTGDNHFALKSGNYHIRSAIK